MRTGVKRVVPMWRLLHVWASGPAQAQIAWCQLLQGIRDHYVAGLRGFELEVIVAEVRRSGWIGHVGKVHITVSRRAQADSELVCACRFDRHFGSSRLPDEVLDGGE